MAIDVQNLRLLNDTGNSAVDGITADATLTGDLIGTGETAFSRVELDYNIDGIANEAILADDLGTFTYAPIHLPYGPVTVQARGMQWDQTSGQLEAGAWASLSFALIEESPAGVAQLGLANDTGVSSTDQITLDPTLSGTVAGTGGLAYRRIEFDHDGNGAPDGSAVTDDLGNFTYRPSGLPAGAVNVSARVQAWNYNQRQLVFSTWTTCSFTLEIQARPAPEINTLVLLRDTGASANDGITTNPTLTGSLSGTGSLSFVTVQFDHDGDGTPDGLTMTDAAGAFTYTPKGLSHGTHTIQARVRLG